MASKKPLTRPDRPGAAAAPDRERPRLRGLPRLALGIAESTVSLRLRSLQTSGRSAATASTSTRSPSAPRAGAHRDPSRSSTAAAEVESFRRAAPSLPGVLSLFHMAGADDFLLHVVARDAAELREFVLAHLAGHPAVQHTETNLIFEHAEGSGWQDLVGESD